MTHALVEVVRNIKIVMGSKNMKIRKATSKDFNLLYEIGLKTPEFKVSSSEEFMDKDEFLLAIKSIRGVFLLAEFGQEIVGFIYAHRKDEPKMQKKWACLTYLVTKPEYRKVGVAQKLYKQCLKELKALGITNLYVWANCESDGSIIYFMKKNGFSEGHKYLWMDKKI
jgi:N-acetylglutamate synthase-like GNAT family acetyltransferase